MPLSYPIYRLLKASAISFSWLCQLFPIFRTLLTKYTGLLTANNKQKRKKGIVVLMKRILKIGEINGEVLVV